MSSNGTQKTPLLITPEEAKKSRASLIDVTWFMPNSPRNARVEFQQRRLPDARYFDLDEVASKHPLGLAHMMPSSNVFARACEDVGITPSTHVVLYDSQGVFSSPRALFMFKAFGHERSSVLNGGLPRWEAEGLPLETGELQRIERTKYDPPSLNERVVRSYEEMVVNSAHDPSESLAIELVLDARSKGRFDGTDPEPRPGLSSGHMPHSRSLPFNTLLSTNTTTSSATYTTLLPKESLQKVVENALGPQYVQDALKTRTRGIVNSCGSGMTAAVIWLALQELGIDSALYDESWTGYASRKESAIIKS